MVNTEFVEAYIETVEKVIFTFNLSAVEGSNLLFLNNASTTLSMKLYLNSISSTVSLETATENVIEQFFQMGLKTKMLTSSVV